MAALFSLGAGEIVNNALSKVIDYQLTKYRYNINQIKSELKHFEVKFKMSSPDFYRKFEAGELGDEEPFFEWSGLYENILLYEKRINELTPLISE